VTQQPQADRQQNDPQADPTGQGDSQAGEQPGPSGYRPPPLVCLGPRVSPVASRMIALAALVPAVTVLFAAARLLPDPSGTGTHRQLELPPCGFEVSTGLPCPTCGMTTAFCYMVRGRPIRALRVQPMGALLSVATILTIPVSLVVLITGRGWRVDWYRLRPDRLLWLLLALFLGTWGFKLLLTVLARR
jgi:hypothetical protein